MHASKAQSTASSAIFTASLGRSCKCSGNRLLRSRLVDTGKQVLGAAGSSRRAKGPPAGISHKIISALLLSLCFLRPPCRCAADCAVTLERERDKSIRFLDLSRERKGQEAEREGERRALKLPAAHSPPPTSFFHHLFLFLVDAWQDPEQRRQASPAHHVLI